MNTRLGIAAIVLCLVVLGAVYAAEVAQTPTPAAIKEGQLTGDFLVVNIRSIEAAFVVKDYELVTIGGKVFLRGVAANIGDDGPRRAGMVVYLAVDDIVAIRAFTWAQAESYFRGSFREER